MATTVLVSSVQELKDALAAADAGTVIEMAAGNYGNFDLSPAAGDDLIFSGEVTIRSADPGNPAVIGEIFVKDAVNLTLEGLTFDYTFELGDTWVATDAVEFKDCTGLTIRDCTFVGDLDGTPGGEFEGYPTAHGLKIRGGSDVTVEGCDISGFARGLKVTESDDVVIRDNALHGQRMDHVVCYKLDGITIENNHLSNHNAALGSTDHRDMIQFWTGTSTTPSRDIVIRDNVMVLGEASGSAQSIFMGNEAVTLYNAGPEMYYQNVSITGNVIVNAHTNGIRGGPYNGLTIANNTLIYDEMADDLGSAPPRIAIDDRSLNVTITDNVTPEINGDIGQGDWTVTGNLITDLQDPTNPAHYANLFINSGGGTLSELANIQTIPGSLIDTMDVGAPMLDYDATPAALTALIAPTRDASDWTSYSFDAAFTAGAEGQLGEGAVYHWDFGDGTIETGLQATHRFSASGTYTVTLTVLDADGSSDTTTTRVVIKEPLVLSLDTTTNSFVSHELSGDTEVLVSSTQTSGTTTAGGLVFADNATSYSLSKSLIANLFGASDFRMELSLFGEDWAENSGEILRQHNAFFVEINEDGTVSATVYPVDEASVTVTSNVTLADGDWTDVSLRFFGTGGTLELWIDGVQAGSVATTGALPEMGSWNMNFGENFGRESFVGEIGLLEIHANEALHPGLQAGPNAPDPEYDLRAEYAIDTSVIALFGDVTVEEDGGALITLAGDGGYVVISDTPLSPDNSVLTVSFDYRRDEADGAQARLIWNHRKLGIEAVEDGLAISVLTAENVFQQIRLADLGLNDTDWHAITVHVDETADLLFVELDDEIVFVELGLDLLLDDPFRSKTYDWHIGGAWNGFLDGEIGDVSIAETYPDEVPIADILSWVPDDPDSIIFM